MNGPADPPGGGTGDRQSAQDGWTRKQADAMALWASGLSVADIARLTGARKPWVAGWVLELSAAEQLRGLQASLKRIAVVPL